jgi:hypothetical protein
MTNTSETRLSGMYRYRTIITVLLSIAGFSMLGQVELLYLGSRSSAWQTEVSNSYVEADFNMHYCEIEIRSFSSGVAYHINRGVIRRTWHGFGVITRPAYILVRVPDSAIAISLAVVLASLLYLCIFVGSFFRRVNTRAFMVLVPGAENGTRPVEPPKEEGK